MNRFFYSSILISVISILLFQTFRANMLEAKLKTMQLQAVKKQIELQEKSAKLVKSLKENLEIKSVLKKGETVESLVSDFFTN